MARQRAVVFESDDFDKYERRLRVRLVEHVRQGTEGVVGAAKQYIIETDAIITGDLYRSVHGEYTAKGTESEVVADVDYASFVHDGTETMEARPFFTEAVKRVGPVAQHRLDQILEDEE
jgi:hypothetical protein